MYSDPGTTQTAWSGTLDPDELRARTRSRRASRAACARRRRSSRAGGSGSRPPDRRSPSPGGTRRGGRRTPARSPGRPARSTARAPARRRRTSHRSPTASRRSAATSRDRRSSWWAPWSWWWVAAAARGLGGGRRLHRRRGRDRRGGELVVDRARGRRGLRGHRHVAACVAVGRVERERDPRHERDPDHGGVRDPVPSERRRRSCPPQRARYARSIGFRFIEDWLSPGGNQSSLNRA